MPGPTRYIREVAAANARRLRQPAGRAGAAACTAPAGGSAPASRATARTGSRALVDRDEGPLDPGAVAGGVDARAPRSGTRRRGAPPGPPSASTSSKSHPMSRNSSGRTGRTRIRGTTGRPRRSPRYRGRPASRRPRRRARPVPPGRPPSARTTIRGHTGAAPGGAAAGCGSARRRAADRCCPRRSGRSARCQTPGRGDGPGLQRRDGDVGTEICELGREGECHRSRSGEHHPPAGQEALSLGPASATPPAVMTPGRVQPGSGGGRSCAPGAMITRFAAGYRARPGRSSGPRIAVHPTGPGSRSTTLTRGGTSIGRARRRPGVDQRPARSAIAARAVRGVGHGEARSRLLEDLTAQARPFVDEQGAQARASVVASAADMPAGAHPRSPGRRVPVLVDHGSAALRHRREVVDAEVLLVQRRQRPVVLRLAEEGVERRDRVRRCPSAPPRHRSDVPSGFENATGFSAFPLALLNCASR